MKAPTTKPKSGTPTKTSAAKAPAAKQEEPSTESRIVKQVGQFEFMITSGLPVPEFKAPTAGSRALPFKDIFAQMKAGDHFFLPTTFWTGDPAQGGRGTPVEKVTSGFVRGKVRGAWNELQKAEPAKYDGRTIQMFAREAGDDEGRFKEAGFSIFMLDAKE